MSAASPGPFHVIPVRTQGHGGPQIRADDGTFVADVYHTGDEAETEANSFLLRAAPEMLEACLAWEKLEARIPRTQTLADLETNDLLYEEARILTRAALNRRTPPRPGT